MPGLRGLHRDLRGFRVTDLAEQDHVGILAEDRPERARERQLDLLVDLRLVHAGDLVLDRILDRDDVRPLRLHGLEGRAERRRLAAAGRADDEDHAVLVAEEAAQQLERRRREPELLERRHALPVVEDAHHDLLAEERAQRRDAEVHLAAIVGLHAQAAVLRQALLGDVHARHDLQACDEALVHPLGQVHHFLEQAVEAVPDEHALFHGLDVDVARLALDRALHHEVDQVDDRRGLAALLQAGDRLEDFLFGPPHEARARVHFPAAPAATRLARGNREVRALPRLRDARERLVGIAGLDRLGDFDARRDDLLDAIAGLELEVLHEAEQQRIGHRDRQQVLLEAHGDADALQRDVLGNQHHRRRVRRVFREVDVREAELEGERLGDLFLRGEVHPDEDHAHTLAGALVLVERALQVLFRDQPGLNQALADLFAQRRVLALTH